MLIGLTLGSIFGVLLKARRGRFITAIALGMIGAATGALLPALVGSASHVDVGNPEYLIRAAGGSLLLLVLAALFRPATLPGD